MAVGGVGSDVVPVTLRGRRRIPCDSSLEEMLMRCRRPLVVIVVACTLTATACGGSPTASRDGGGNPELANAAQQVYDKFNGLAGQERTDELLKAAKSEGEVSV